jgi:uncharacterized C2H2 Zn-finger protein
MSERETQLAEVEIGRCHVCAQLFQTQEDLLRHLKEAHGVESLLQPAPKQSRQVGKRQDLESSAASGAERLQALLQREAVGRS